MFLALRTDLYLVFLVIVKMISTIFTFKFSPKLQEKHSKEHYDYYDRENKIQSPSLSLKKVERPRNFFWGQPSHFTQRAMKTEKLVKTEEATKIILHKAKVSRKLMKECAQNFSWGENRKWLLCRENSWKYNRQLNCGIAISFCK